MTDTVCTEARVAQLERQLLHARAGIAKCAQESSHESLAVRWNREIRCVRLTDVSTVTTRQCTHGHASVVRTVHNENFVNKASVTTVLRKHPESLLLVSPGFALNPANIAVMQSIGSGRVLLRMYGSDAALTLAYRSAVRVRAWLDRDAGALADEPLQPEVIPCS